MNGILRKAQQLLHDPILRRWLAGRILGKWPGEPAYTSHRPDYLESLPPVLLRAPKPPVPFGDIRESAPDHALRLPLPGAERDLKPGEASLLFRPPHEDLETLLAVHRFAWLPLLENAVDPAWVDVLWRQWCKDFGTPDDTWAWHPYTATERVINVLDFAAHYGLPGEKEATLKILAAHGPAIAQRLEYFGESNTSNHLSNNGRGLYRLGLALGLNDCIGRGADILLKEAKRIFLPSGILREGSSHYHLLLARNYADAWLAAHKHCRPEERPLRAIAVRALAVIPHLKLPGRFPLIGDISPDCPPDFLTGLYGGDDGWIGNLDENDRIAMRDLISTAGKTDESPLVGDGWLRFDYGPWSGVWYVAPDGWLPMPGHAHQDIGGFELHYGADPVFIDPGRGAYGETGDAARYRSGLVHNTLLVDRQAPYPPNKPYYNDAFRRAACGPTPSLQSSTTSVEISHAGYSRLRGVEAVRRTWQFAENGFTIADHVGGSRQFLISRLLHTPFPVEKTESGAVIFGKAATYFVEASVPAKIESITAWSAYGHGDSATALVFERREKLPCELYLSIKVQPKAN